MGSRISRLGSERGEPSAHSTRPPARVIDSYLHCGISKYEPWQTVFAAHAAVGVTSGVLVQHLGEYDNEYIVTAAQRLPALYRSVVLVDRTQADWRRALRDLASQPGVVGVRVKPERSTRWEDIVVEADRLGLHTILYLIDGAEAWEPAILELTGECREGAIVLTHLGTPNLTPGGFPAVERLAARPNVVLQLSGLGLWSTPPYAETVASVRRLLDAFGQGRVIWGSNYPVQRLDIELAYALADPWGVGHERIRDMTSDFPSILWRID
jgi:predicted TIM-barrel fold metal-dependent hydrolase